MNWSELMVLAGNGFSVKLPGIEAEDRSADLGERLTRQHGSSWTFTVQGLSMRAHARQMHERGVGGPS
ncbi:hypothetical protein MSIMFI_05421 [Mycobacterium simulans]|nr:hypothetical protein MSIMFI_05421 [Mycobacterium simulans]